jgi:hypothetical protein
MVSASFSPKEIVGIGERAMSIVSVRQVDAAAEAESSGIGCTDFLHREPNVEAPRAGSRMRLRIGHDECRGGWLRMLELAQRSLLQ